MKTTHIQKLTLLAAFLALAGCAQFKNVSPGTPLAEIEKQFGVPTLSCDLPNGGTRSVWSQQPYGDTAWAVDVSPEGQTGKLTQVLTDASFARLDKGIWKPEDVRCAFGPPVDVEKVGPPAAKKVVWSYRYLQSGVWHSMMYVYFGSDGEQVTNYHAGPDPMFMYDWGFMTAR